MRQTEPSLHPALRLIVVEATEALARLDADRLEELVLSCKKLSREFSPHPESYDAAASTSLLVAGIPPSFTEKNLHLNRSASPEMAVFSRLLSLTRENLAVFTRARVQGDSPLEYSDKEAALNWPDMEVRDGKHK
jgi:hypothetical protein